MFSHTADLGVEVSGTSPADLFSQAALAVFDLMADLSLVNPVETRKITVEGSDREDLLVNFLRELLYLYHGSNWLLKTCRAEEIDGHRLRAELAGEPLRPGHHRLLREIKAVTYHRLRVEAKGDRWEATVVFDV